MSDVPEISIVIEWENVILAEDDRAFRMLRQLRMQLDEIGRKVEVIVLFNPRQIERSVIARTLVEYLGPGGENGSPDVRVEEAEGGHYYDLKNEGAARAWGEIVVLLDSDVIPEDNWLKSLIQPFDDNPEVSVVAGHTYLAHTSLAEKAFALGWLYPFRNGEDHLDSNGRKFWANNSAFRRETLLKFPFPEMAPGMSRKACTQLARTLVASGVPIWTQTAARVEHPAPSGLRHSVVRALAHGRDNVLWTEAGRSFSGKLMKNWDWNRKRVLRTAKRIRHERHRIELPLWQAPIAFAIMCGFYSIVFTGSCITLLFPRYAGDHWRI